MVQVSNPKPLSLRLFTSYQKDIERSRQVLIEHIEQCYGKEVADKIKEKLIRRISSSRTPLQAEIWPWLLRKCFYWQSDDRREFEKYVREWYALYLLVVIIDDAADKKEMIDMEILMPLIVLSAPFIAHDGGYLSQRAVNGQLNDIHQNPDPEKNAFMKILAEKINSIGITSNVSGSEKKFTDVFAGDDMLGLLQLLDDLEDVDEDLKCGHPSLLITKGMISTKYTSFVTLIGDRQVHPTDMAGIILRLSLGSEQALRLKNVLIQANKSEALDLDDEIDYFNDLSVHFQFWIELIERIEKGGKNGRPVKKEEYDNYVGGMST